MLFCPVLVPRITQPFAARPDYYGKYGHAGHNGIDFGPPVPGQRGAIVFAPHDGYVRHFNEGSVGYGRYVELLSLPFNNLGRRRKSDLAHLFAFLIPDGAFVSQGDPVGIMGGGKGMSGAGDSTAIHLHWAYKLADRDGRTLDRGNGYNGAIDVTPYVRQWLDKRIG